MEVEEEEEEVVVEEEGEVNQEGYEKVAVAVVARSSLLECGGVAYVSSSTRAPPGQS